MKKVLIAISGGIAAYKVLDVIRKLKSNDCEVHVVSTDNGYKFVTPTTLSTLSDKLIIETDTEITHIKEANWCDIFLCAPSTANIIAKFNHGIADDLVSTIFLAIPNHIPKVVCPSMNDKMFENPITQKNILELSYLPNLYIIEPDSGMLACGYEGKGKLADTNKIVETVLNIVDKSPIWNWPLDSQPIGTTIDSYSFLDFDVNELCEIPLHPHVGAFGIRRRHDVHKGIDLYALLNSNVYAVEDGTIIDICPFTGPKAGYDWWLDTDGIYVQGESGIVVYGEIGVKEGLRIGSKIVKGQHIANVKRVIVKDKGRPNCMLHLELHDKDWLHTPQWEINENQHRGILDPTPFLIRSFKNLKK